MKKFLSVVLALLMVVSTVSFAAPTAVTVVDTASEADAAKVTTETTDDTAELSADSEYGTLVFNIDFEKDGISFTKNTAVDVNKITDNYNSEICPSGIIFTPKDFVEDPQLITDANGNTYLNCVNSTAAAGYRFFQITENRNAFDWKDGTFTMVIDYYYTGGLNAIAFHVNSGTSYTAVSPVVYKNGTWQTAIAQYSNQLNHFYIAPGYAANYTNNFGVDNIRLYYSADTVKVTVKADNATQTTANGVVNVSTSTGMTVSDIVANANMTDLMGIAETKDGAMLPASTVVTPVYAKSYYGVFGFDVNVLSNGNSAVSNVTVSDVDTRKGITVGELIAKVNNTSGIVLRGLSETVDGEPLATSTKINVNKTLYMIWEADESEYGTLLAHIDFENLAAGTALTTNNLTVENFDSDALTNGEFTVVWEVGADKIVEENGDKYIRGGQKYAQIRLIGTKYGASVSPMPDGTYTFVVDAVNFGTTERTVNASTQGSGVAGTIIDSFVKTPNSWDKVVGQWNGTTYDMTLNFADAATTDVGFDDIKLYYAPAANATFCVTVNANGKAGASNTTVNVAAGNKVSVAALKAAMPGCIGIAETANGEMLPNNASILPAYNKTVYAVWGFDVTLDAGLNTDMSNVVVSDIDTRKGITIGELLAKINNTTDRTLLGLATARDGSVLDESTVVSAASTYYMIWEFNESEYGTLVFNIDFEKDGISAPGTGDYVDINDMTDIYNKDLVLDKVYFGARYGTSNEIVTSGNNTYLVSTGKGGSTYINLYIKEASDYIDWLDGTYTAMVDAMVLDTKASAVVSHVNDLATGITATSLDGFSNEIGVWDTVTYTFSGKLSYDSLKNHYYIAFLMPEGKQIAFDNYKLYFKTDETVITLKANGNSDISDIEVPVNTSTGITVAELIAKANEYETTHTLLGISKTGTGELLSEDTLIKPLYQETYYLIWRTADNDPTISTQYGKLLFNVDFEKESLLESGWDGQLSLDDTRYTAGTYPAYIASYYDEEIFRPNGKNKNFRIKFLTSNDATDATIKTDASGNHYISGTAFSQWPQIVISNNEKVVVGNGYYTVFFNSYSATGATVTMGVNQPAGSTIIEGGNAANTAFSVPNGEWNSYGFKFEVSGDAMFPNFVINYSLAVTDKETATVGWDDFKVYYKPYEATVKILPGDYEEFGESTITGIDTTTSTTLGNVISSLESDIELSGREFVGLMDRYGEMVDLEKNVIIPCDMTYTIVWADEDFEIDTVRSNSIRISTNEYSGIRFAANALKEKTSKAAKYGWVLAAEEVLSANGVRATSLIKETQGTLGKRIQVGYNYDASQSDARKHLYDDDESATFTVVVYNLSAAYYNKVIVARPFIEIDGVTYYGRPWRRTIYDVAKKLLENYDGESEEEDLNGKTEDDMYTYLKNIVDTVEGNA